MTSDDELLRGLRDAAREDRDGLDEPRVLDQAAEDRIAARLAGALPRPVPPAPIPLAPRRGLPRPVAVVVSVLAFAAAATLVVRFTPVRGDLPAYEVSIVGSEQSTRGADTAATTVKVRPGGAFRVELRPATRASGAIEARAFVEQAGQTRAFEGTIEIAEGGAIRVASTPAELSRLKPGRARLIVMIGRPGSLPQTPGAAVPPSVKAYDVALDVGE